MKILILIRSLSQGGAQRQVVNLANELVNIKHQVTVCVFYSGEPLEERLSKGRIKFVSMNKQSRWDVIGPVRRFIFTLRQTSPDILYSFLGGSNILSGFAKLVFPNSKILWGIRSSNMDLAEYDKLSKIIFTIERKMSFLPDMIVANSYAGKSHLLRNGFPGQKIRVVHNGIDTNQFYVDINKKDILKDRLSFSRSFFLIGIVARIDPKKDHKSFIKAASIVASKRHDINFVVVGRGDPKKTRELQEQVQKLRLSKRIKFIGPQKDMNLIYNGLDLLCLSSSFGEGFPNVLGEAMACGTPCVATGVGDSHIIIGDTGIIVPPRNSRALSKAMMEMIEKIKSSRQCLEKRVTERIRNKFPNEEMVAKTLSIFNSTINE
jgi:glycosyltransferase involved in cell wall biosynthesis